MDEKIRQPFHSKYYWFGGETFSVEWIKATGSRPAGWNSMISRFYKTQRRNPWCDAIRPVFMRLTTRIYGRADSVNLIFPTRLPKTSSISPRYWKDRLTYYTYRIWAIGYEPFRLFFTDPMTYYRFSILQCVKRKI